MEGFCRGCLVRYDEPLDLLQYTEKNRRLFVYSTGIQVKRNDVLTFQLCRNCYISMKMACKFKKLCRTSDKKFKQYLYLKEVDDSIDLYNHLKHNEVNINFRLPLMSGNSTPANHKVKDDDNESTCTSIHNFMKDILQGEEMPDTEARIIKEVIEEAADVLDDSLDSYFLQDDASIDTDFSFSPFSTPRPEKNDQMYTRTQSSKEKDIEELNYYTSKEIKEKPDLVDELNIINDAIKNIPSDDRRLSENHDNEIFDELVVSPKNDIVIFNELMISPKNDNEIYNQREVIPKDNNEINSESVNIGINAQNYYVQRDIFNDNLDTIEDKDKNDQCIIDKNLEMALKNKSTDKFCLDDLLMSPPVFTNGSMTPIIANILFSEKLDSSSPVNHVGQFIEQFQNVEGHDNLDGFFDGEFNQDNNEIDSNHLKENFVSNNNVSFEKINENDVRDIWKLENNFDLDNFYCKFCEKKFLGLRTFKLHVTRLHKLKIIIKEKRVYNNCKDKICDICGKAFRDKSNFSRHKKMHRLQKPDKVYRCDTCLLVCLNQIKLDQHMKTHNPKSESEDITKKRYMCNICGKGLSTKSNFNIHQARHAKNFKFHCTECGKGFYRTTDLTDHMRYHTFEKPFQCPHCHSYFAQKTILAQHIKKIHLVRKYFQCDCCANKYKSKKDLIKHLKKRTIKLHKKNKIATI